MIDCQHVIVQRVVFVFFPVKFYQTIPNKRKYDCTNYVRNIFQRLLEHLSTSHTCFLTGQIFTNSSPGSQFLSLNLAETLTY